MGNRNTMLCNRDASAQAYLFKQAGKVRLGFIHTDSLHLRLQFWSNTSLNRNSSSVKRSGSATGARTYVKCGKRGHLIPGEVFHPMNTAPHLAFVNVAESGFFAEERVVLRPS